jgi:hypothetical protein
VYADIEEKRRKDREYAREHRAKRIVATEKWCKNNQARLAARLVAKARLRQEFLRWLKAVPCADCRRGFPHYVMEFDHARGKKRYNISAMNWHSLPSIQREAAKCDVVCANCHKARTWKRHNPQQSGHDNIRPVP